MAYEDPDFEYPAYFVGPCTCLHDEQQHGWVGCDMGCPCDAHWEE